MNETTRADEQLLISIQEGLKDTRIISGEHRVSDIGTPGHAVLISTARRLHERREQAGRDSLTGVYNHGEFERRLGEEKAYADRHRNRRWTEVMLDIDDFKEVNDTYGHLEGDMVLKKIAMQLEKEVRPSDIVGRWGGEEFALAMRGIKRKDLITILCRINKSIREEKFKTSSDIPFRVTVSMGVAFYRQGEEIPDVVGRADGALYMCKQNGKNCIYMANGPHVKQRYTRIDVQ